MINKLLFSIFLLLGVGQGVHAETLENSYSYTGHVGFHVLNNSHQSVEIYVYDGRPRFEDMEAHLVVENGESTFVDVQLLSTNSVWLVMRAMDGTISSKHLEIQMMDHPEMLCEIYSEAAGLHLADEWYFDNIREELWTFMSISQIGVAVISQ